MAPTSSNNADISTWTTEAPTPCSASNTIEPEMKLPPAPKFSFKISKPASESESGLSNELSDELPMLPTAANVPTSTTTHAARTVRRRRNANDPRRSQIDAFGPSGVAPSPSALLDNLFMNGSMVGTMRLCKH